jgi:D-galacturonate reductase
MQPKMFGEDMSHPVDVTIIGGGMITNDLILPSVYHLQRIGIVRDVQVCALNSWPLLELQQNSEIKDAFPNQSFKPFPDTNEPKDKLFADLYKEVLAAMPPRQAVIIATPDQFHYTMVMQALEANQHILCVKPLVLKYEQSREIEKFAYEKGLFVGIEYHKRFDRRSLLAKKSYAAGNFGDFIMGEAKMIEPFYYRFSNFQNWFTTDHTDPFVYVGCHYVDLAYFITGLKPTQVSVQGVKGSFPNGKEGYMWANGRVRFENGALLTVTDGLGYPDDGAGSNEQCLTMFCEKGDKAGLIKHNDQFRGVSHSYIDNKTSAGKHFNFINPDFYRLVPWEGEGLKPVGYGFESIAATINTIFRIENESVAPNDDEKALSARRQTIKSIDEKGIIATPANSYVNELVVEAARASILADGRAVNIVYGDIPKIEMK